MEKRKKYIAYGSNLNLEQMARRCPTAKVIGAGEIRDHELLFRISGVGSGNGGTKEGSRCSCSYLGGLDRRMKEIWIFTKDIRGFMAR